MKYQFPVLNFLLHFKTCALFKYIYFNLTIFIFKKQNKFNLTVDIRNRNHEDQIIFYQTFQLEQSDLVVLHTAEYITNATWVVAIASQFTCIKWQLNIKWWMLISSKTNGAWMKRGSYRWEKGVWRIIYCMVQSQIFIKIIRNDMTT